MDEQGESPFVWGTLGGDPSGPERIELITGVTCPTTRIHPAIVARTAFFDFYEREVLPAFA